jgi:hypothetical protein
MKVLVVAVLLALQSSLPVTFEDGRAPVGSPINTLASASTLHGWWTMPPRALRDFPHSGTHALTLCHERQPCRDTTFVLTFSPAPAARQGLGRRPGTFGQTIFVIEAYDSLGTFMGNSGAGVNPAGFPASSCRSRFIPTRTRSHRSGSWCRALYPGFAIDDIEFARAGDAPESAPGRMWISEPTRVPRRRLTI